MVFRRCNNLKRESFMIIIIAYNLMNCARKAKNLKGGRLNLIVAACLQICNRPRCDILST